MTHDTPIVTQQSMDWAFSSANPNYIDRPIRKYFSYVWLDLFWSQFYGKGKSLMGAAALATAVEREAR
jgi:hypothetical protein